MPQFFTVRINDDRLQQILRDSPDVADDLIEAVAMEGLALVRRSFNTSPPGRTYRRGRVAHVASVAGYPPNIDTGKLMNALYIHKPKAMTRAISTGDTEYAAALEFGTVKMAARPFMRPMAEELRKIAPEVFDRLI
ncbi:MAG: hypothetical protein IT320_12115 [Anaerolineae bacterium]|nr:hypothetical protein [Anaerolineae bacterium]